MHTDPRTTNHTPAPAAAHARTPSSSSGSVPTDADATDDARRRAAFATVLIAPNVIPDTVHARYGWDENTGNRPIIVTYQQTTPDGPINCVRIFDNT